MVMPLLVVPEVEVEVVESVCVETEVLVVSVVCSAAVWVGAEEGLVLKKLTAPIPAITSMSAIMAPNNILFIYSITTLLRVYFAFCYGFATYHTWPTSCPSMSPETLSWLKK